MAMIKNVTLIDEQTHTILYRGRGQIDLLKNNGYEVQFGNDERQYVWKIWNNGLIIISKADYILELTLRLNARTKGHLETEFGRIDLHCKTSLYKINENCVEVRYVMEEDGSQIFHFKLEVDKGDKYAIN